MLGVFYQPWGAFHRGKVTWADPGLRSTRTIMSRLREHLEWMGDDVIVYTFRHTCASRLVQRGAPIEKVRIWLGHKTIAMTLRYAKFKPDHISDLSDLLK